MRLEIDFLEVEKAAPAQPPYSMSTIYSRPYGELSLDPFETRVGMSIARAIVGHDRQDDWIFRLYLHLTPAPLDAPLLLRATPGTASSGRLARPTSLWRRLSAWFRRSSREEGRVDVLVHLDRERWESASLVEKRTLLGELVARTWSLVADPLGVSEACVHRALEEVAAMPTRLKSDAARIEAEGCVHINRSVADDLELSRWQRAAPARRAEIVKAIGAALDGFALRPDGERWVHEKRELEFAIVPGGRFVPGIARFEVRARQWFHSFNGEPSSSLWLAGSDAPCDLGPKAEADIGPFLIATTPLGDNMKLVDWKFDWNEAVAICASLGMSLPTSVEVEWAARAGQDVLFPWGDDCEPILDEVNFWAAELASAHDLRAGVENPRQERNSELILARNDFGLFAPLARHTWCLPNFDHDIAPHVIRGGGLDYFHWKNGADSAPFFTSFETRWAIDLGLRRACVQPVIRLIAD
jgi:hypothetical protein